MHLEMLEWYFRSLLPQYLGDILTFWKLTVVTERRTRQLEGRCCKKRWEMARWSPFKGLRDPAIERLCGAWTYLEACQKSQKTTLTPALVGRPWVGRDDHDDGDIQKKMETSSIIKGVLRQTMNRWLVSGVVSAAKSNLVGMDIRQPGAWGTIPTVKGVQGVLSQLYNVIMGYYIMGYYPNCTRGTWVQVQGYTRCTRGTIPTVQCMHPRVMRQKRRAVRLVDCRHIHYYYHYYSCCSVCCPGAWTSHVSEYN